MNIRKRTVSKRRLHAEYPVFEAAPGEDADLANGFSEKLLSLTAEKARLEPDVSFTLTCDIRREGEFDEIVFTLRGTKHARRVFQRRLRTVFLAGLIKEFEFDPRTP